MKIAIIGCRGIPANYGGFETFAHGLTENLSEKGYDITVSCEYKAKNCRADSFKGSKLQYFPIKPPKNYLIRKFYENLSDIYFLLKLSRRNEIIYFLGIEVGMFLFIPKLLNRKIRVLVNIDGVMWERKKFNRFERWLLKLNHKMALKFADKIITDSKSMKTYVDKKYWDKTEYLSYGINLPDHIPWNGDVLNRLKNYSSIDIFPGKYFLVVARLEPENNIHTIVDAFCKAQIDIPLVIVGDYTSESYKDQVENLAEACVHPGVIFMGSIYDQDLLNMLRQNSAAYIHGHSVGGTNPSLLEAAICRSIIIAHENMFNMEICGKSAIYFSNETELARKMKLVYRFNENYLDIKNNIYYQVKKNHLWSKITADYHSLLQMIEADMKDMKLPAEDLKLIKEDIELIIEDIELISKESERIAKDSAIKAKNTKIISDGKISDDGKMMAKIEEFT